MGIFEASLSHATHKIALPTKDILSWIFDEPSYELELPLLIDAADPQRVLTGADAKRLIRQLIAGFRAAGVQQGDCIGIHSFNDILYPIIVLGIIGAGAVYAGTNPAYTEYELNHHIKIAKVKFLISEPEILPPLAKAASACDISSDRIWIFNPLPQQQVTPGYASWTSLLTHGEQDWVRFHDLEICRTSDAARLFSSGTTGLPKAARSTHLNLIAQHECAIASNPKPDLEEINLYSLPMFHAAIAPRAHTSILKTGEKTYIMRRFELEAFAANIEKFHITSLVIVPPIAIGLIMSPVVRKYSLKSIRWGGIGAAPLSKESQSRLLAMLADDATLNQVWGMTETSCIATMFPWPEKDVTGSVGRLIPNLEAKLVDDDGKDISGFDVRGELCVRGPTVIPGYFENEEANRASFDEDGFFHTGDIAYCDGATKGFYIVDRKKELIKVRGFQVAPPELEGILLTHPDIVDAAVIGIEGAERDSEAPRAYVVRRPGSEAIKLDEAAVKAFVEPKLASYKKLDGGVRFVESIPKNASGKVIIATSPVFRETDVY
jgi:acyl-CoA synthetase (AMP-forming)/AMP-acid ligase II